MIDDGGAPVPEVDVLSPKSRVQLVRVAPTPGVLVEPSKVTVSGAVPEAGLALRRAVGAGEVTVMLTLAVSVWPSLWVTVRTALKVPGVE
ncbi:MAG: hypothetical protein V7605_618 [Acidimicrobiaceae bacterium]